MNVKKDEKRHYWLREDFDHLMGLLPGGGMDMPDGNKKASSLQYPKYTEGAVAELKFRGLVCDPNQLAALVQDGIVHPERMEGSDGIHLWSREDIDQAAEYLYEHDFWSPWTHFCYVGNLRYGQAVKAYRVAAAKYNLPVIMGFDVLGLHTVIQPAENAGTEYGWIRFYPAEVDLEVREGA